MKKSTPSSSIHSAANPSRTGGGGDEDGAGFGSKDERVSTALKVVAWGGRFHPLDRAPGQERSTARPVTIREVSAGAWRRYAIPVSIFASKSMT